MSVIPIADIFSGKTVLFQSPQSVIETVRCARYLKGLEGIATTILLEDKHGLGEIFKTINPEISIVTQKIDNTFDLVYDLNKLGCLVRDRAYDSSLFPYLKVPEHLKRKTQEIIGQSESLKVGLGLQNSEGYIPVSLTDISNNLTIQQTFNTEFFAFINGKDESSLNARKIHYREELAFEEFGNGGITALIAEMDIIISFENIIAHLAGALGKPVWLLVPFDMDDQQVASFLHSYPLVTVFRQRLPSDWGQVFLDISLFRHFNSGASAFSPFTVEGIKLPAQDTIAMPDVGIESTDSISNLLKVDVGQLTNVQIETTSICNLRCPYCPNSTVGRPSEFMEEERFYRIIDSLKDYNSCYSGSIAPHFYGEPLIDIRMEKLISYTRQSFPDSFIEIYTNGELLTIDRYLALKEAGVNIFKISQHTTLPSKTVSDTLSYISQNYPDLLTVDFKIFHSTRFKLNRGGLVETEVVSDEMLKNAIGCQMAHRVMTFDYKGNAVICCNDYLSKHSFGNIDNRSITEIWNEPGYKKIRNLLMLGYLPLEICRVCVYGSHQGKL